MSTLTPAAPPTPEIGVLFDMPAPIGPLAASVRGGALRTLRFADAPSLAGEQDGSDAPVDDRDHEVIDALRSWLELFAAGREPKTRVPLAPEGTPFQRSVWSAIERVLRGRTITYTALAEAAGRPSAVRAAASACGANPIPLLIPCHRIVGAGAGLGGFSGGLDRKRALLEAEGWRIERGRIARAEDE